MSDKTGGSRPPLVVLAGGLAKRFGGCKPLAPVGLHGEAVIDLTASDALAAGFGEIVMVLGPQTAPAIRYHVGRCWPRSVQVASTVQPVPLGTAHAVLCARPLLPKGPFAVVNADDVYGVPALELLAMELSKAADEQAGLSGPEARAAIAAEHMLVSFALSDTVVTHEPVTRGTCVVGPDGHLSAIVERRRVTMHPDGRFTSDDGLEPGEIPGETPVSVNLWGFAEAIWPVLEAAVTAAYPQVAPDGSVAGDGVANDGPEVLLPEVVGGLLDGGGGPGGGPAHRVKVLEGPGRCLGVTHADDLPVVRSELATMVGQGIRPEGIWEGAG
ncbi:MAG TPA: sugar phosphate nucleotidyltransferase [Acidimicrobiales bacterium]|nr:sugar phosphate nucleotidyltransferase [Acidimicrobiales bacterium]